MGVPDPKNVLLAVGVALVTLAGAEAASYLFGRFDGPLLPLRVGTVELYGRHDPLLFWSLRPHARAPDGSLRTNAEGLRGPEVGPKAPGEFRILSLGESSTYAVGVDYDDSYSARLERLLQAGRSAPVRVINAGVPGYTLFQGVQFLLHRSARFEPDMVLFYFGGNDFLPVAHLAERAGDARGALGLNDWELFERRKEPRSRITSFLIEHSNLYRGLLQGVVRASLTVDSGRPRVPREHRERLLSMALDYCRERGITFALIVPVYREFEDHIELLREFAARNAVPIVDLPELLSSRWAKPRAAYFLDAAHPTPEGHALLADAIHEVISPLVPKSGAS